MVDAPRTMPELSDLMLVREFEEADTSSAESDLLWHGERRAMPNLYGQLPQLFRDEVSHLAVIDAPLPGTACPARPQVPHGSSSSRPRVGSFLASASRYISCATSRDHESCPVFPAYSGPRSA